MRAVRIPLVVLVLWSTGQFAISQTQWTRVDSMPVVWPAGGFDFTRAHDACALFEGQIFRLWYSGNSAIGDVLSLDGRHWYRALDSPVIAEGRGPSVIKDGEGYKMYYYTGPEWTHVINLATSADGYAWTSYPGNPVLTAGSSRTWEDVGVWNPCVIYEDSIYRMWYQAYASSGYSSIGYATSTDGIVWTKSSQNPVVEHGHPNDFDDLTAGQPSVVWSGSRYDMLYTGVGSTTAVGYAFSEDGLRWTKYRGNPVFSASSRFWEDARVAAGGLLFKDSVFYHWYGANGSSGSWVIGFATAPLETNPLSADRTDGAGQLPTSLELSNAHPNPFNPGTTISYQLPAAGHVVMKVFNMLGQEVAELVNEMQEAGHKSVSFDASNLPSGVYAYMLTVGTVSKTKRMSLIR